MKPEPQPRHTVLLVGRDKTDEAFLGHLKSLYVPRGGMAVKIRTVGSKASDIVVNHAINLARRFAAERILALLDTTVPIEESTRDEAAKHNIHLVEFDPCIESLLLKVLKKRVPSTSEKCEHLCAGYFGGSLTEQDSYGRLTHALLEKARGEEAVLAQLLDSFAG